MSTQPSALGVVIVPACGGAPLDAALAAVTWADERAVLTLDRDLTVPPGVGRLADPSDIARLGTQWVLVLAEAERVAPEDVGALRAATSGDRVLALPVITSLLGMDVRLSRRVARLAQRGTPLVVRAGSSLEFRATGRAQALDVPVRRARGTTLTDAVDLMGAEANTFAALADRRHGPARAILWQPLLAGWRAATGHAPAGRLGMGRWIIAVFEGYRVLVAYARLWERRRDRRVVDA